MIGAVSTKRLWSLHLGVGVIILFIYPMSILQSFKKQCPPRGPGLVVSPRFRELSEKPGYLSLKDGSQELRNLYVDG